ncbi:MAG: DUF6288 domain-containing protein [Lentisphaeria bacterium]
MKTIALVNRFMASLFFLFLWCAFCGSASAEPVDGLRLGSPFSDSAVLQRNVKLPVWGWGNADAKVTVSFAGQQVQAVADDDGYWRVEMEALEANSSPKKMTVSTAAGDKKVVKDLVVGDVWLFARQTSIDISLGRDKAGKKIAAKHESPPLYRALSIQTIPSSAPRATLAAEATSGWSRVDEEIAKKMSAAAYFFGRDLVETEQIPVGILDLNLGSAFPISWLSREALEETDKLYGKSDVPRMINRFDKLFELKSQGEPMPKGEQVKSDIAEYAICPSTGYNAVLHPLKGLALKGMLIQLGNDYPYMVYSELKKSGKQFDRDELNRAYVQTYDIRKNGWRMEPVTTPRIPKEWRAVFGNEELPVGLVMPPGSALNTLGIHHREMREMQRQTAEKKRGVSVILPGSENLPFSAQPEDEALLGERCLKWARGVAYDMSETAPTGPLFEKLDTNFNKATIHFKDGTAEGLRDRDDALDYFEAAPVEGEYSPAEAAIEGETIRIKSDTVNRIARVRYNWNQRPDQGLVNEAGLPAVPFRSEDAPYKWFIRNTEKDLPIEYSTPANEWKGGDVTLVNGQLKTHGYPNFTGWLGPVGVRTGPFGPNMGVREVKPGSPADGKLFEGDVIYSANGNMLGEKAWKVMAAAITESETAEAEGKLVLGVRRGGKNLDVEVNLEVMGTYSSTAPFDCPKTEKIVSNLEDWVISQGAGEGFLNSTAIFLLATGNPDVLGFVRRVIYKRMAGMDPNKTIEPRKGMKSWHSSAHAFLFGEYYLATGDRNVLPYLKWFCDRLAATQHPFGGWRHNYPGIDTYGLIPNAGLPGVMGMHFAKEAGLDIDMESYRLGVKHFGNKRAETGFLIYGLGGCQREKPPVFDPEVMANGKLTTYNGGLSAAGILMEFVGKYRAAHLCSLISAFAWNNTFGGHGGNFWNNFWTPLGAYQHGREAFIHFWKNYRWYRECNRMFDGSLIQRASGAVGAGPGVALVAPRQRLQIVGAPASPFAADAPEYLKPALDAHAKKDYATCEKLTNELLASGEVGKNDRSTVENLARAAREMQESIAADLARMRKLAESGKPGEAKSFLRELAGVLPEGDERLAEIKQVIASAKPVEKSQSADKKTAGKTEKTEKKRDWKCLVNEITTPRNRSRGKKWTQGKFSPEEANVWRLKVVEDLAQAPEGWTKPGFDDADWGKTHLPISWRMYHTALLRTKFNVDDKKAFDLLRFRAWLFRQQGIEIYVNGKIIGKVNNLKKKTGNVDSEFNKSALRHLKNGENTLAVTTRHNWRWGMLFMKVYNDGFGFRLDARLAE